MTASIDISRRMLGDDDLVVPQWPVPRNVRALVTTRAGGVGTGPLASFNLAEHVVGNDAAQRAAVAENRRRLRVLLPSEPCWLAQVHGNRVVKIASDRDRNSPEADAAITFDDDVVLTVLVADCLPVLLARADGTAVGIAHAGWRGLSAGVVANAARALGAPRQRLVAWLGPAIGPDAFEVGGEVREAFVRAAPAAAAAFRSGRLDKWFADLYALARLQLADVGVVDVRGGGFCTFTESQRFYSYRRDRVTGRMAALIWRSGTR